MNSKIYMAIYFWNNFNFCIFVKNYNNMRNKYIDHLRYLRKKEEMLERQKEYRNTPMGRAVRLSNNYKHADENAGRGESTLTAQWIVDNIFSKPCAHCGKTGWDVVGCNRLNDDLPHTPDNVEPCCEECNKDLEYNKRKRQINQYDLNCNLIKTWNSLSDVVDNGFCRPIIIDCCNNKYITKKGSNIYKNCVWQYV